MSLDLSFQGRFGPYDFAYNYDRRLALGHGLTRVGRRKEIGWFSRRVVVTLACRMR